MGRTQRFDEGYITLNGENIFFKDITVVEKSIPPIRTSTALLDIPSSKEFIINNFNKEDLSKLSDSEFSLNLSGDYILEGCIFLNNKSNPIQLKGKFNRML